MIDLKNRSYKPCMLSRLWWEKMFFAVNTQSFEFHIWKKTTNQISMIFCLLSQCNDREQETGLTLETNIHYGSLLLCTSIFWPKTAASSVVTHDYYENKNRIQLFPPTFYYGHVLIWALENHRSMNTLQGWLTQQIYTQLSMSCEKLEFFG